MSRILVADDDKMIRRVFEKAMGSLADEVEVAGNGREALEFVRQHDDIDLIVSDWTMPEMDGAELLRQVKASPATREIPFIMLTAKDNISDVIKSLGDGAGDYIRKPCHVSEVVLRAKNLITMKRMQDQMQQQSITDGLTGLFNHRHFMDRLQEEVERADRYQGHLSFIFFDIDHFKTFNDAHGHQAGDEVLRVLGAELSKHIRKIDTAARYGGEEFAVIAPGIDLEKARVLAEHIAERVRALKVEFEGKQLTVTISVGISTFRPEDTITTLVKRADDALYEAKNAGRDQIRLESGE